jgi:type IV pilus assembly protein PilP
MRTGWLLVASSVLLFMPVASVTLIAAEPGGVALAQEGYTYQPDGRRDPFTPLIGASLDVRPMKKGEGIAAFGVDDISVRGILQASDRLVAMVQGPDNKTYVMHAGDRLADGVVKSVTPEGLIIEQDITDPLSTQTQREVRKLLRSLEEAKE